jgi:DNA-binding transcriptional MerR regulator
MLIQEVEKLTGVTSYTIRYYEKIGLLPQLQRKASGVRVFTPADINYLQFITTLKKTGMSLEDILIFMQDGCILEKVSAGDIPFEIVAERVALLMKQQESLNQRRVELDMLVAAINQKLNYYNSLLASK